MKLLQASLISFGVTASWVCWCMAPDCSYGPVSLEMIHSNNTLHPQSKEHWGWAIFNPGIASLTSAEISPHRLHPWQGYSFSRSPERFEDYRVTSKVCFAVSNADTSTTIHATLPHKHLLLQCPPLPRASRQATAPTDTQVKGWDVLYISCPEPPA